MFANGGYRVLGVSLGNVCCVEFICFGVVCISKFKTIILNNYFKHVMYNLFMGCSFTDMTRRFVDYMCVAFCCKLVRCSYLYVVLFSILGCVLRCLVVVCCDFLCFD